MKLSKAIDKVSGLRFLIEDLEIISVPARKMLYSLPFMTNESEIIKSFNDTTEIYGLLVDEESRQTISLIQMKLMQIKDINGTIKYIATNNVKDDIELFELKHFAILSEAIRLYVNELDLECIKIPELKDLITVLDPDNKQIPTFHIYDAYSDKLAECRKQYKHFKGVGNEDKVEEFRFKATELEDEIRLELSNKVRLFAKDLADAMNAVSKLDLLLAKANQIKKYNLCKPEISDDKISLKGMFNPQIAHQLINDRKAFQPIDIDVLKGATLIVGANMAGKSVILKTVALIQYLMQFGFYVPCTSAKLCPVETVYVSLGDGQNEMKGLSSFGAEMLQLNEIITEINSGKRILVLLDELARTTNPTEGKAIVSSMVELLENHQVLSLITTHYSGIGVECNRLRVKGFREDKVVGNLDAGNINDYMDYSLQKDLSDDVPFEAIRIAEILGISKDLLDSAKKYLEN